MKKLMFLISMALVFCLEGVVGTANAAIVTFDDLYPEVSSGGYYPITDQYSDLGITFAQTFAVYWWNQDHVARQYEGDVAAVSYYPHTKYNSSIFTFDAPLLSLSLLVDGYDANPNNAVDTSGVSLTFYNNAGDTVLSFAEDHLVNQTWNSWSFDNLENLSATIVEITGTRGYFGFNDIGFELDPPNSLPPLSSPSDPAPEPSSVLLLGLGLACLCWIRTKFIAR